MAAVFANTENEGEKVAALSSGTMTGGQKVACCGSKRMYSLRHVLDRGAFHSDPNACTGICRSLLRDHTSFCTLGRDALGMTSENKLWHVFSLMKAPDAEPQSKPVSKQLFRPHHRWAARDTESKTCERDAYRIAQMVPVSLQDISLVCISLIESGGAPRLGI